jgi:hypothetical protein
MFAGLASWEARMSRETAAAEFWPQIQQLWEAIDEHRQVMSDLRRSVAEARELREELEQSKMEWSEVCRATRQRD